MRAVVLTAPGELSVVDHWAEPECGPRDVVIRMRAVGLCGTDLAAYDGKSALPGSPWVIGHEGGGEIVRVGESVRDREVGQQVVVEPNMGCGRCARCAEGRTSACEERVSVGFGIPGLLSELVSVPAEYTWVVPDLSPVALACLEPLVVADQAVRRAGVGAGDHCLVVGAGSVGQLVCHAVRAAGAVPFVVEPHDGRRALAERLGARPHRADDGKTYPFVFETAGVAAVWDTAFEAVAKGGTLTLIGFGRQPVSFLPMDLVRRQVTVRGHIIYDHPSDFATTIESVREGLLTPDIAVEARFDIADTPEAFTQVRALPGKTWIDFASWWR
jgi:2-desacetyl-2-hydroxyethyl bacteriochlorophyllide A dehydrogenase